MVAVTHPARSSPSSTTLDGTHLIVFDSYDPTRVPSLPLPIPAGSRPGKVTTTPVVSELVVELVAAHQGIAILPRWVATPYEAAGRITTVRLSRTPEIRTWHCVTPPGCPAPPHPGLRRDAPGALRTQPNAMAVTGTGSRSSRAASSPWGPSAGRHPNAELAEGDLEVVSVPAGPLVKSPTTPPTPRTPANRSLRRDVLAQPRPPTRTVAQEPGPTCHPGTGS
jgi:hypothetical protein